MPNNESHTTEFTGAGLVRFLDFAIEKGYLKTSTGQSMKTASREVLSAAEGESWEKLDLAEIDVDDVARRFETLRAMKFSPSSLRTYRSRFQKSLEMFREFTVDPAGWRPAATQRTRVKRSAEGPASEVTRNPESVAAQAAAASPSVGVITYPFPLRDGVLVSLQLPPDLSKREAGRLAAFIDSLAIEESVDRSTAPERFRN